MSEPRPPALSGAVVGALLGALSAALLASWGNPGPDGLGFAVDPLIGAMIGAVVGRRLRRADTLSTIGLGLMASLLVLPLGGLIEHAGWFYEAIGARIGIPDLLLFLLGSMLNPVFSVALGDPDPAVLLLIPAGQIWAFSSYRLIQGSNPSAPVWLTA